VAFSFEGGEKVGKIVHILLSFFLSPLIIFNSALLKKKLPHVSWLYYFLFFFFLCNILQWQLTFFLNNPWRYLEKVLAVANYRKIEVKDIAYADLINKHAHNNSLDPCLVASVIAQESAFQSQAISPTGAKGLMQIIPGTWKMLWEKGYVDKKYIYQRALEPEANIAVGSKYLKILINKYQGNIVLALAAYNAGHGNVDKYHGVPPFTETRLYVKSVAQNWSQMRVDFPYGKLIAHPFLQTNYRYFFFLNCSIWLILFFWLYRTRSLFYRF